MIPKKPSKKLSERKKEDKECLAHRFMTVVKVTEMLGISDSFRININNGEEAEQGVFHLHIHILGGRKFNWPPG